MTSSSSASPDRLRALSCTAAAVDATSPATSCTLPTSRAISRTAVSVWATFSFTCCTPTDACPTFSAMSLVVTDCSSTAAAMVPTIASTSPMTSVICSISRTVWLVACWMP
ncbi:hypothetical protein DSECCO2_310610 [anaerobic digester metagenome]